MTITTTDQEIDDLLKLRGEISEKELQLRRARAITRSAKALTAAVPAVLAISWVASYSVGTLFDLGPAWTVVGVLSGAAGVAAIILWVVGAEMELLAPHRLGLDLERLYDEQALYFGADRIELTLRQEIYRGATIRDVATLRKRGDGYRVVNNALQSVVIVGSLATTTVASISPAEGPIKWLAVGFSAAVGLSAGFTGYFKYRERAFYLRQTADDLEEQLNAYNLGLGPYKEGTTAERRAELTSRIEAIRVAQQRREQQLDQPKGPAESS
ncbi:DUF4231 domain-containing protein [Plantibacter sp. YIM 135347]|uniref:DUF4231 domain-containing protein n=1 Tax=Plantibacter sp. YIM 135347 TaxID=3423919 RepID=UPI003D358F06